MSTKIYNGYRLPARPLTDLMPLLFQFRESVQEWCKGEAHRLAAHNVADIFDSTALGKRPEIERDAERIASDLHLKDNWYWSTWVKDDVCEPMMAGIMVTAGLIDLQERNDRRTALAYDFTCRVSIHPLKSKTLAMLWTEKKPLIALWKSLPGVQEHPYWDCTDRPRGMSERAWSDRRRDWDKAIPNFTPAASGLMFDAAINFDNRPFVDDCMKLLPTHGQRVRRFAINAASSAYLKQIRKQADADDKDDWGKFLHQTAKWLDSDDGKAAVAKQAARIGKALPIGLPREMLSQKITLAQAGPRGKSSPKL